MLWRLYWWIIACIIMIGVLWYGIAATIGVDDTDWDGVIEDRCPEIPWEKENLGCPILDETCLVDSELDTCGNGFECSTKGICVVKRTASKKLGCVYPSDGSSTFWNVLECNSNYSLNFVNEIRKCDVIFPAITSKDGTTLYSRGEVYQVPYNY